jgi:hypothetical protein
MPKKDPSPSLAIRHEANSGSSLAQVCALDYADAPARSHSAESRQCSGVLPCNTESSKSSAMLLRVVQATQRSAYFALVKHPNKNQHINVSMVTTNQEIIEFRFTWSAI